MFRAIFWSTVAVLLGLVTAFVFVIGTEVVWAVLYPLPVGVDPTDCDVLSEHIAALPPQAFVIATFGWGLSVFACSWVATRLGAGRHWAHGVVLGLLLLAAAVMNMSMLTYPLYFWISNLVVFPVCFLLGAGLAQPRAVRPAV